MGLRGRNGLADENCFFVTTSCYQRQHLLVDEKCFILLTENLKFYCQKYKAHIVGYVFMVNHVHFIIYFESRNCLSAFMRDFKKYTSLQIRKHLEQTHHELIEGIRYSYKSQHFKIWEDRYDDVALYSRNVCEIKMEYIHHNPVKAGLVNDPIQYKYSSAAFYLADNKKSELLDYRELF